MSIRSDLLATGVYERIVSMLSNLRQPNGQPRTGQLGAGAGPVNLAINALRRELGLQGTATVRAYMEIADEARKAVNAARRLDLTDPSAQIPPMRGLPCPDAPGERCDGGYQIQGFVDVYDPVTGVRTRVPFVIRTDKQLTSAELADLVGKSTLNSFADRGYDKGGQINPATATTGALVITGITGRS